MPQPVHGSRAAMCFDQCRCHRECRAFSLAEPSRGGRPMAGSRGSGSLARSQTGAAAGLASEATSAGMGSSCRADGEADLRRDCGRDPWHGRALRSAFASSVRLVRQGFVSGRSPMLTVHRPARPSTSSADLRKRDRIRSARASAPSRPMSYSTTANSSPPSRPIEIARCRAWRSRFRRKFAEPRRRRRDRSGR